MDSLPTIDLGAAEANQNRRRSMRRYWIFFGIAGALVLFGLISMYYRSNKVSAPEISDAVFIRQANAKCARFLPPLINKQPQRGEDLKTPQIVKRVNETADGMQKLETQLAAIPVAAADQENVALWLDSWKKYILAGQRYADALGENDKTAYQIGNDSSAHSAKITAFAIVNDLPACQLRTQQSSSIM